MIDYLLVRFRAGPNVVRHAVLEAARAIASEQSIPIIIEALQFGTLQTRPTLRRRDLALMLWRALWM